MDFLTANQNLPFAIALVLMLFMAVFQAFSVFGGGTDSLATEPGTEASPDAVVGDAAASAGSGTPSDASPVIGDSAQNPAFQSVDAHHTFGHTLVYSILAWLQIGKIPTMIVFVLLLMTFGTGGLVFQKFFHAFTGGLLHPLLASIPAAAFAVFTSGLVGRWIAPIIPRDETEAVSADSFIGLSATIIRGSASWNRPAEAKLQDRIGRTHYVMVEPEDKGATFHAGDEVQLILRKGGRYLVIPGPFKMSEIKRITTNHPPQANL